MQAAEFIRKWQAGAPASELGERAGAQAHFIDLCRVLGTPEPGDPDHYCFERGLTKTGSAAGRTDGFADVWMQGHFAWEYKAPGKSLEGALRQLMMYALPLAIALQFSELAALSTATPMASSGGTSMDYLALKCLKDIEHQVNLEAEELGLNRQHDLTGPHNVLGIELNEYAAELARVTVWIGELQWRIQRGYGFKTRPVLEPLDHIVCRDAVLNADGTEASWPKADSVVGNPPFVGNKKMRAELGDTYTEALRAAYEGRVPGGADLVCYWFERARAQIECGQLHRAGLVATNSIRGGVNRTVLDAIVATTRIFEAWSDEPWVNEGAAVRVSQVAFGTAAQHAALDGVGVTAIGPNLEAVATSVHSGEPLLGSQGVSFQGPVKVGAFDVPGDQARAWLREPNPNGRSNAEVLRPWVNGLDIVRRPTDMWIIDFGVHMPEGEAACFEAPYSHVEANVKPTRLAQRRESRAKW